MPFELPFVAPFAAPFVATFVVSLVLLLVFPFLVPGSSSVQRRSTSPIKACIAFPRTRPHSITSSWLTSDTSSYVGLHLFVINDTAKHLMPQCRAAMTSYVVDIPSASTPTTAAKRCSAIV